MVKGYTKSYTQGVWYSKKSDSNGVHVDKSVNVVVAAEQVSGASTVFTTLIALAGVVAALAF